MLETLILELESSIFDEERVSSLSVEMESSLRRLNQLREGFRETSIGCCCCCCCDPVTTNGGKLTTLPSRRDKTEVVAATSTSNTRSEPTDDDEGFLSEVRESLMRSNTLLPLWCCRCCCCGCCCCCCCCCWPQALVSLYPAAPMEACKSRRSPSPVVAIQGICWKSEDINYYFSANVLLRTRSMTEFEQPFPGWDSAQQPTNEWMQCDCFAGLFHRRVVRWSWS